MLVPQNGLCMLFSKLLRFNSFRCFRKNLPLHSMCNVNVLSAVHNLNCVGHGNWYRLPLLFCVKFCGCYGKGCQGSWCPAIGARKNAWPRHAVARQGRQARLCAQTVSPRY